MSRENEVFQKMRPDFNRFAACGFREEAGGYVLTREFMDGEFAVELRVAKDGAVSGRILDRETGEEYLPARISSHAGPFVNTVREACRAALQDVADRCFTPLPFLSPQANRLAEWLRENFGDRPDFPFKRYPGFGAFRGRAGGKWYALVLHVDRKALGDGEGVVELLNVRAPSEEVPALLERPGIRPAYHMNKKNWISVILDGTVPDEEAARLAAESRDLVLGGGAAGGCWLIPANPKYYDLESAFEEHEVLTWKQSHRFRTGDTIYIYMTAPIAAVLYRCEVIETDIPDEEEGRRYKNIIRIRRLRKFGRETFTRAMMRQYGVHGVRSPRGVPEALRRALDAL